LSFFSFEHYPMDPCKIQWSNLYDEATLVTHMLDIWHRDGVPANIPMFITESNIAWQSEEAFINTWGALWLADYVGSYLSAGGNAVYFFHYIPLGVHRGCNNSLGTFGLFSTDANLKIEQPLSQYFASQLINLEWVEPAGAAHRLFAASSDVQDDAGHTLVTAYAALRPDGKWSLLIVNKDQENSHGVRIAFHDANANRDREFSGPVDFITFGSEQYQWHPGFDDGKADPDGPLARSSINATPAKVFEIPKASITVIRGAIAP